MVRCVEVRGHSPGPSGCYLCVVSTHLPVGLLLSSHLLPSPDTGLPGQSLGPTYCRLCGSVSLQATAALHSEATLVLSSAGENAIHIVPIHCVFMYRCLISMYMSRRSVVACSFKLAFPGAHPTYMCVCVHSSCSAQTGQHEACMCDCCPRPVGALQLICWKLLSKRHDIV